MSNTERCPSVTAMAVSHGNSHLPIGCHRDGLPQHTLPNRQVNALNSSTPALHLSCSIHSFTSGRALRGNHPCIGAPSVARVSMIRQVRRHAHRALATLVRSNSNMTANWNTHLSTHALPCKRPSDPPRTCFSVSCCCPKMRFLPHTHSAHVSPALTATRRCLPMRTYRIDRARHRALAGPRARDFYMRKTTTAPRSACLHRTCDKQEQLAVSTSKVHNMNVSCCSWDQQSDRRRKKRLRCNYYD
jgi:hypothetical protein